MLGTLKILNFDRRARSANTAHPDRRRRRSRPFPAAFRIEPLDGRLLLSAGDLDASFGSGGLLVQDFGFGDDFAYAVAVQSDGRILVAGTVQGSNGTTDFGLARFMPNGSLDVTFGSGGFVRTDFGLTSASIDEARSIAIDPSGRIYVSGYANRGINNDFAVARYNPDGSLDGSFGAGGVAVNSFNGNDQAFAMALQPDGKVLLAGLVSNDFGIARYTTGGALDTSFGTGGWVRTSMGTSLDAATCIAVGADGRITVGGYVQFSANFDYCAARLNPDGSLDTSLNGTGKVTTSILNTVDQPTSIVLYDDGKFALAGRNGGNVMIIRYNAIGSRDSTFGSSGIANIDLGGSNDTANAMLPTSDGKLLLAGVVGNADTSRDFAVFRVTANGALDATFGNNGLSRTDFAGDIDQAFGMALGPDGKLVVAGRTTASSASPFSYNFALARYEIAPNQLPTALISGAGSVAEGSSTLLDGAGSSDPDGSIVSYEWDFDYDGSTFTTDATGGSAIFSAAGLDGPTTRTVALRVTDDRGGTHIVTHAMSVTNVAPTISISGSGSASEGSAYTLTLGAVSDPGSDTVSQYVIHWGDGTSSTIDAGELPPDRGVQHTYADGSNSYAISVDLVDEDGSYSDRANAHSVSVGNVAPTLSVSGSGSASEGSAYTLMLGPVSDPGSDTVSQYVIHWDDGTSSVIDAAGLSTDRSVQHTYADGAASYAVTVDLIDEDGTHTNRAGAHNVDVSNVAPTLTISGNGSVNEGSPYTLTLGPVSDPGADSVTQYVIHWGDGSSSVIDAADLSADRTVSHTYADGSGSYAITVDLADEDGSYADRANSFSVSVNDVAPSMTISGSSSVNEGSSYGLTLGSVSDPGNDSVSQYVIHWGDGTNSTVNANELPNDRIVRHTYADGSATFAITIDLVNEDGAHLNRANPMSVGVNNVAPTATLSGPASGTSGQAMTFTVNYADPGADTHTIRWEFGDGTVFETSASGGTASLSHTFSAAGSFTVRITVLDDDGGAGSAQMNVNVTAPTVEQPTYEFIPDPQRPGKMMLVVKGTSGDDCIRFIKRGGGIELRMNGRGYGVFNVTSRIVANGYAGHDAILADDHLGLPVQFCGGAGNDRLVGSNKDDVLDGGDGNDLLCGRNGNDRLLGGAGCDTLHGGNGDDTLDGGGGGDVLDDIDGNNSFIADAKDRVRKQTLTLSKAKK